MSPLSGARDRQFTDKRGVRRKSKHKKKKKVEGGGVKEREDEKREKTGGLFHFRKYALVSAWTSFGTSID